MKKIKIRIKIKITRGTQESETHPELPGWEVFPLQVGVAGAECPRAIKSFRMI
jgi:hypothetical protein